MSSKNGTKAPMPEFIRKSIVSLKRKPQNIPMVLMAISFLIYSLNLTSVSDTTAKIQGAGMGLCGFCTMLFSILSFVCFLNAFPHRKKINIPMLALMFAMFGIVIFCDINYINAIAAALNRPENPIALNKNTMYIAKAYNMLNDHVVWMIVTAVMVALVPVYGKLLRKINTSVDVEDNGKLDEIDISGE